MLVIPPAGTNPDQPNSSSRRSPKLANLELFPPKFVLLKRAILGPASWLLGVRFVLGLLRNDTEGALPVVSGRVDDNGAFGICAV